MPTKWRCRNYGDCSLADRRERLDVGGFCPDCGLRVFPDTRQGTVKYFGTRLLPRILGTIALGAVTAMVVMIFTGDPADTPGPSRAADPARTPLAAAGSPSRKDPPIPPAPTPAPLNLDKASAENDGVIREVLQRIDLAPNLSAEAKGKIYSQVARARAMGRVALLEFKGGTTLPSSEVEKLKREMASPERAQLINDPTAVFVVAGYADKIGNDEANLRLSISRAEEVVKLLRSECQVLNLIQPVGMGSSDLFGERDPAKNRIAEVWVVLP